MKKNKIPILLILFLFSFFYISESHNVNKEKFLFGINEISRLSGAKDKLNAEDLKYIGVDEKSNLGKKIALDSEFTDENGKKIILRKYVNKPTLILPVYYYCPETCGLMLGNLSLAVNNVPLTPGKDYLVLALSIDSEDDIGSAQRAKNNYFKLIKKPFPDSDWKYLTGNLYNINRFADSAGFRFKRTAKHEFIHPNVLIVVAADGTIIRYLYGPDFLPFDVGMALTEATRGVPSISIRKVLSLCFRYDPGTKSYSFTIVRYLVVGILALMGIVLFFILRKKK